MLLHSHNPKCKLMCYSRLPNLCLNLHGQRTIFAAGHTNTPASLSFFAPAVDPERSITPARKWPRSWSRLWREHETSTSWGIGRYNDSFNINLQDYFIVQGVPTILFEAGIIPMITLKTTRTLVTKSIIDCLNSCRAGCDYIRSRLPCYTREH